MRVDCVEGETIDGEMGVKAEVWPTKAAVAM